MPIVRSYVDKDLSEIFELMKHWGNDYSYTEEQIKNSLKRIKEYTDNKILVAQEDNKLIGYTQIAKCFYLGYEPFIEVVQLLVAEPYRATGIGHALMSAVESEAHREGIKMIRLHSQVHRSMAHVFYEKLGFNFYKISKFYEKKL